ncbi:ABC transporter ATP-binding protein [Cedecea sp. P7760]|jgi:putative ABC transport system ATP-binding protein|uniref:ABC transporter ATP-binding protein n=1 Tax=Cedecea sp. P7760 TaxID=2726983 RepID=UPI0015A37EA9|nr:ABC transporter ATP-binding protein [Cedecea sp. P7760]NWC64571.1 ABC transporter ATP-binding protein [Cedecea sp. P7760]
MLHINNLCIIRGNGDTAHQVTLPQLKLRQGQIMAITGESGCGKSTLLEAIGLLLRPSDISDFSLQSAQQRLDVAALIKQDRQNELAKIRARLLGFVLQNGGLLPYLTVQENILLPCQLLGIVPDKPMLNRIVESLKLGPLLKKYPAQLSFGERQRTAFARAVSHRPELVLADEPTAALDPHNARQLFSLFIDLVRQEGMMALVVCHDWPLIEQFNLPCLRARSGGNSASIPERREQGGTAFVL